MIINYVPGEECRVAIVEDGKLEELYVERFATANRVGNIYVGRVVNVEAAIQAAFVDFGVGENGFLHVSDLHPRYFPGEGDETTERVGHKTPRRERPPIQHALRRGDEVIVQVLKEGVGTKGPTVTSYLSIPGRFLVMMPQMDNIGVSRKVEDDEQRRQMREILDQLDLPEGFGFILRTAGFQRTKTELKRDLSYLQRLWKDMERRLKSSNSKTRLLYSESDLLVRSLRDLLTGDISQVIIDHETALRRASRFMKIVAPRGSTQLMRYSEQTPIFHAFGIEEQIALIHAREVPLPSGGRLVIDQTEALVAIDVNSGRSRDSRDSETNAYQTNIEAVDEICRQLRLRDMGGIVINDLIDMRRAEHRKDIENRFKERLKKDRARSTILSISEFGILEMTRQRMRPSHESVHFSDCPTCRGRGIVQKSDSVASECLRDLAMLLAVEKVSRVELVVSPRVAGELLSTKRQLLTRIERTYTKRVDVRVSEAVPVDRVSFYAYDPTGNDVDLTSLPRPKKPREVVPWEEELPADANWADTSGEHVVEVEPEPVDEVVDDFASHPIEQDESSDDAEPAPAAGDGRRRRRGRGRGSQSRASSGQPQSNSRQGRQQQPPAPPQEDHDAPAEPNPDGVNDGPRNPAESGEPGGAGEGGGSRRRRRRRGRRGRGRGARDGTPTTESGAESAGGTDSQSPEAEGDDGSLMAQEAEADRFALSAEQPVTLAEDSSDANGAASDEQGDEGDSQDDNAPSGDDQPQQGEKRRRRRRRRGRRGGGSGNGSDGRPNDARGNGAADGQRAPDGQRGDGPRSDNQRQNDRPRNQDRRDGRDGRDGRRDQRPRDNQRPPRDAAPPPPPPPPPPAAPAAPKPRTLYGAMKRKLSASELNRRPKPE
jgi:ribonuclease E